MFRYNVLDEEANIFSQNGLRLAATQLLQAVSTLGREQDSGIIFVSNDLGGVLVKQVSRKTSFAMFHELTS